MVLIYPNMHNRISDNSKYLIKISNRSFSIYNISINILGTIVHTIEYITSNAVNSKNVQNNPISFFFIYTQISLKKFKKFFSFFSMLSASENSFQFKFNCHSFFECRSRCWILRNNIATTCNLYLVIVLIKQAN